MQITPRRPFTTLKRPAALIFLICGLIGTRIACRSHYLYDIDSVNFALGLRRFDPSAHQPHPPGYFLYVCLGRLMNLLFQDANATLVAISIAGSCGALLMIYALTDYWFGKSAAFFAGLTFLFSPLVWFHGTVALTYSSEAFFSALTGYLGWRVYCGSEKLIVPAVVTLAMGAGVRPSFLLFLSPLVVFSILMRPGGIDRRKSIIVLSALLLTLGAWVFPMLKASGGINAYWSALVSLWRVAPGKETVFNSPIAMSIARLFSIAAIGLLCFGSASLLVFRAGRAGSEDDRPKIRFVLVWIGPGLLFFTLVFLKFVNSGYLLVISPPLFAYLGLWGSKLYSESRWPAMTKTGVVALFALANTLIYAMAPVYCSFASVRSFEKQLENVLRDVQRAASPDDTLIIGFDSHFLGYRHAGYYLPGWFTAQYPEVRLVSGIRVFVMEQGDTSLAKSLPLSRFQRFIFFPLPDDDREYKEYMDLVRARFPAGALQTVSVGDRKFTTGAVADLKYLFPVIAGAAYPIGHIAPERVDSR